MLKRTNDVSNEMYMQGGAALRLHSSAEANAGTKDSAEGIHIAAKLILARISRVVGTAMRTLWAHAYSK